MPVKHPPIQDVIELFHGTAASEDVERLMNWHIRPKPEWNYNTLHRLVASASVGASKDEVKDEALRSGAPSGRKANAEAILAAHPFLFKRAKLKPTRLKLDRFPFRNDIQLKTNISHVIVEDDGPKIILINPRKGLILNETQISIWMEILKRMLVRDGHSIIPIEIIDVSAPDKRERLGKVWHSTEVPSVSEFDITEMIQRYIHSYDQLIEINFQTVKKTRRTRPDTSPGLFD